MSDIVKRLRDASAIPTGLYSEAADEIEKLRKELAILKPHKDCDKSCLLSCKMEADEIERLRKQRDELVWALENLIANHVGPEPEPVIAAFKQARTLLAKIEGEVNGN